jgi:capsular exopolysaccharide synthesis family protein
MIARTDRNLLDDVQSRGPVAYGAEAPAKSIPLLSIIWRRRWTVLLVTLVCTLAAVVYIVTATPVYTSTSRVYVEQIGPQMFTDQGVVTKSDTYLQTQAEMVTSTPILASAIEAVNAKAMKSFAGVNENLAVYLKKQLNVDVGRKDEIISVSFDSPYPVEAATLVNAVVDAYVTYQSGQKHSTAAEMLKILEKEKAARDAELNAQMRAAVDFKTKNGALSFDTEKGNIVMDQLSQLTQALVQAQVDTVAAKRQFDEATTMLKDPKGLQNLVELYQSKGYTYEDREYGEMRAQLTQLRIQDKGMQNFEMTGHPRRSAFRDAIQDLEKQIIEKEERLAKAYISDLERQVKTAQAKEDQLQGMTDAQRKVAMELNAKATEYVKMTDDIHRTQSECDMLQQRIREIAVTGDTGALNINILEVARPEEKPSKPRKPLVLAAALMVGLVLGTGLGVTRELIDHRFRNADEVTAALGLPVLGIVPHMPDKQPVSVRGRTVHLEPMSPTSESYRTIRTAIFFGAPSDQTKAILVTSPEAGDGKSTSASNLAIAMAQAGHRTLLLDCDFRKPTQHKIFELDENVGINSVLEGQLRLRDAIQRTPVRLLHVLPCGPIPPNPSEILNGKRFAVVMKALLEFYDKVVIDSPPVTAVTDARILSASADCTLMVLRAEKSTRRVSAQARDSLISVGANLLGVVFNDLSKKKGGYYAGYGYYGYRSSRQVSSRPAHELAAPDRSLGAPAGVLGGDDLA